MINLIPRFYDVCEGSVLVDDIDVREYNLKNLRERISVALQKSEIFQSTIKENIRWGRENATDTDIANAASIAQAMEFISTSADGFDTLVTQQGTSLSGGQKQRVAAARAIITHPSLILADEPTGALDSKSSKDLLESLKLLNETEHTAILMVTHDAYTASYARRVIFIKDGKVFHELLKGTEERRSFFEQIMDVISLLGGDMNYAD